ncbi:LysR family transcriptional regulator [Enterobacteriaceae bacterium H11S18]|uniref:LysR family transcriptional regulator n=1 Tax=Dryocola clanedunensis TaxID=2925396 RepID=UPI0022F00D0B|nr:LysR family transcriptional regulator [Dryocola clanedunensis]MCT4706872.1 LysR family transcriptional regulator [Dryocola clanedunensis]MCT4712400.1 LysR family transcriptional regulator [Dryocola clanedunensis]
MDDLNIKQLAIINAVIECKSAALAAQKLNISPSAISYTLNQARKITGMKLFTRTAKGLTANPEVFELQKQYQQISSLNSSRSDFIITTYSPIEMILSQHLYKVMNHSETTSLRFITMDCNEENRLVKLKHREVDIDIGGKLPDDKSIICVHYLHSEVCVVVNAAHPTIGNSFSLADWQQNQHLRWRRDEGSIADILDGLKSSETLMMDRDIAYESANLLTLAAICSQSPYIMLIPKIFLPSLKKIFPLKHFDLPDGHSLTFDCYIHYHRSMAANINQLALHDAFESS